MKRNVVLIVVAAALVAATAIAAPPAARLAANIDAAQARFAPAEPVALTLHLANRGAGSVWVLRWQVPSEEIEADILAITRNGEPVEYVGPLVKRPAPTAADYVEIAAGEELTAVFDPTSVYDMNPAGQYSVAFKTWQIDALLASPAGTIRSRLGDAKVERRPVVPEIAEAQAAEFWFDGIDAAPAVEMQAIGGYTKCTTTQQAQLQTAHANAITFTGRSESYLASHSASNTGSIYTLWFGAATASLYSTVTTHFDLINEAFASKPVTYDCGCKKPYYAYVYPTQPYKIYVCKVFWQAPALGRDSKMGTLVHEMSHFNVTAGTDDWVYGENGAKSLALTNPTNAVDNADNHEYFTEDQP
jgi:peptidyl-Lys metalloendopeptidase